MIDWTKPLQCRDGTPFTLLFTNGRGECPIGGYHGDAMGILLYSRCGRFRECATGKEAFAERGIETPNV